MNRYIIFFLLSVFLSAMSQILLKKSAKMHYKSRIREYLNARVMIAYCLFFLSSLVTVYAYKGVPLSLGPILEATGYIWVSIMGYYFLKEKIGKKKRVGLVLIVLGIVLANI